MGLPSPSLGLVPSSPLASLCMEAKEAFYGGENFKPEREALSRVG